jgi:hypothetical protein
MSAPARVHIILARMAETAIIIRRGPSKQVCTLLWNRKRDTFELGQWLKGRIYERRCDLSPDGTHFIYFAMNGKWRTDSMGSWTAISRTPYLKAIGFWPNGSCWNGGGLFLSNSRYWLNAFRFGHHERYRPPKMTSDSTYPFHAYYGGECPGVYYVRLQRDGWRLVSELREGDTGITTFDKSINKEWVLRKRAFETCNHPIGKGCYFDRHVLINQSTGEEREFPDWEWADVDRSRLVWVESGLLYAGKPTKRGLASPKLLYDFNSLSFTAIEAPY